MSKRVVITGSTRGIGNGLAREFLKRDCSVAISSRSADAVTEVVGELGLQYGRHRICGAACDITDPADLQRLWDHAAGAFGGIDVWINNAGMSIERKPLWEQSDHGLEALVHTNLTGALLASKVAMAPLSPCSDDYEAALDRGLVAGARDAREVAGAGDGEARVRGSVDQDRQHVAVGEDALVAQVEPSLLFGLCRHRLEPPNGLGVQLPAPLAGRPEAPLSTQEGTPGRLGGRVGRSTATPC